MSELATVTVLFTDLVGSTGMASRVGPTVAEELRQEHFGILREAIAGSSGTEVKNLGDGLMVVFDSVANGVGCAAAMQQRIERRNRRAEEQLGVRIGLSLGDADRQNGDYFGPPVIEAARLCAKAGGGQILTGEMVRMMAGGRADHRFESVGELELKGIPAAFPAFEIAWEPAGAEAAALLPGRLRQVPPVGYVGRATEREGLTYLWGEARSGTRRVALISGEPGIGKTRLSTHIALQAHGEGSTVLYGRCDEDVGVPYQPWVEALSHYVEAGSEDVLAAHVERHGGELSRLAPELARRVAGAPAPRESDSDTERYLLFGAAVGLLEQASADEPVVLILDDLHWADKPTLLLLKHLVASTAEMSLLVLGTFRDSELSRDHPLTDVLADLRRQEGVTRISLGGLVVDDVVALMEAAAGHEMDEAGTELAREVAHETDGNPFFVAEVLRHLVDTGAIAQGENGRWRLSGTLAELGLPESVREVIGRRIGALGEDVRRVLSSAAVIGRDFDVDVLAPVVDLDVDALLDLLEGAVAAAVLVESADRPGRFTFAHALINHTLYEDLGTTRRARLHARVAESLEALYGDDPGLRLGELANHWSLATQPLSPAKAFEYSRRAGERALAELAPDEAVRWLGRALELVAELPSQDPRDRAALLIPLGEAQRQIGDPVYRDTLLEASRLALDSGDADLAVQAALANTRGFTSTTGQVDDERLAAIEATLELVGDTDSGKRARLLTLLAMESIYRDDDLAGRTALCEEGVALARRAGDGRMLVHTLWQSVLPTLVPATRDEVAARAEEADTTASGLDDPHARFWGRLAMIHARMQYGHMDVVDLHLRGADELAEAVRQPVLRWVSLWSRSWRAFVAGRLDEAEALAERGYDVANESGQPDALVVYAAQLCEVRATQGRVDEIVELLELAVEENPGIPSYAAMLANVYSQDDADENARALLDEAAADSFARLPQDFLWLVGMA
ncbi:MAG: hypothetical protein QOE06_3040, partial [Thermoleophilaceae bacterium]|nr:hypothetical protein [Thermoleophilaceae bacterium]